MRIFCLLKSIDKTQLELILDYFNSKKDILDEPLELLNRAEGGFKINISYLKNDPCNENKKIKQVRWKKGYLDSSGFISFIYKETMLLYESMCKVLGEENVLIEN